MVEDQLISFFSDGLEFDLKDQDSVSQWILKVAESEGKKITDISYIFTTDEKLLVLNRSYLNHDTLTDIITFDYSEGDQISGEIYISLERVRENAVAFKDSAERELRRVMIHGILHLCGYGDKDEEEKKQMRAKEDYYLSLQPF